MKNFVIVEFAEANSNLFESGKGASEHFIAKLFVKKLMFFAHSPTSTFD
jgi:hypothetical protein